MFAERQKEWKTTVKQDIEDVKWSRIILDTQGRELFGCCLWWAGSCEWNQLDECHFVRDPGEEKYKNTGIDALAPALGSVHGFYKGEPNLDFKTMQEINNTLPIPLVLHGGTGIPEDKIKQAISCGISKININTDLQVVWSKAVRKFLNEDEKVYDPRKVIGSGELAMKNQINKIVTIFGTKL